MVSNDDAWSPLLALQRATHATLDVLADELAHLGLSASEINALATLADGRARTVSELAADVGTRPTTVSSVLDRLERRRHITRVAHDGDRRAVLVKLTPTGRRVATTVRRAFTAVEQRALGHLPASSVTALRKALTALTEVSDERA